jgi:two-component system NarL family sensor kinase
MSQENSYIIWIVIVGSAVLIIVGVFIVSFISMYTKSHNRHLTEKKEMEFKFQQELLQTQLEIQEQTLKNISQEIHDNIGQTLSLAKLNLNRIDARQPEMDGERILHSRELVGKAIHDLRSLSRNLNTDMILAAGFLPALESEVQQVNRTGAFTASLEISGNPQKLDAKKELILFRIVQEALNNIIKHSGATSLQVSADFRENQFILSIRDNGKGFEPALPGETQPLGSGLRNMRNRAAMIGGLFNLESSAASGTLIEITIPITNA